MKLNVIAVFDKKTSTYEQPFTVRHLGDALREWDIVRKDPQTKFGKNPEDFTLHKIGTYDDDFGVFENLKPHEHLADGI